MSNVVLPSVKSTGKLKNENFLLLFSILNISLTLIYYEKRMQCYFSQLVLAFSVTSPICLMPVFKDVFLC